MPHFSIQPEGMCYGIMIASLPRPRRKVSCLVLLFQLLIVVGRCSANSCGGRQHLISSRAADRITKNDGRTLNKETAFLGSFSGRTSHQRTLVLRLDKRSYKINKGFIVGPRHPQQPAQEGGGLGSKEAGSCFALFNVNSNIDIKDLWRDDDDDEDFKSSSSSSSPKQNEITQTSAPYPLKDDDEGTTKKSPSNDLTHLIAIPLQDNTDLTVELESVQRAIIYKCPSLVDACIMPAVMRLPLLYIVADVTTTTTTSAHKERDGTSASGTINPFSLETLSSSSVTTEKLCNITQQVFDEFLFRDGTPLKIPFEGLEVDGNGNEILYCVGKSTEDNDDNTTLMIKDIVIRLRQRIQEELPGVRCLFPPDKPQSKGRDNEDDDEQSNDDSREWRPRVPFMRLPIDFLENLPPLDQELEDDEDDSLGLGGLIGSLAENDSMNEDGINSTPYRSPEQGGNGISPILWYKWWNDEFTTREGTLIKEVGIYSSSTSNKNGMDEQTFYVPQRTIDLTSLGTAIMSMDRTSTTTSATTTQQQSDNREEEEEVQLNGSYSAETTTMPTIQASWFDEGAEETSIEKRTELFNQQSDYDDDDDYGEEKDMAETTQQNIQRYLLNKRSERQQSQQANEEVQPTLWTPSSLINQSFSSTGTSTTEFERYGQTIDSRSQEAKLKKPWPKEPLLKKYQKQLNGSSVGSKTPSSSTNVNTLPPYPSNEHFQGVWRLLSNPTDGDGDSSSRSDGEDGTSSSNNIIFRIDGTIAGGPILDRETNQKAAGGTWRIYQAEYVGSDKSMKDKLKTRLQIKFVIPPHKTTELVFDGEVTRFMMPGGSTSTSSVDGVGMQKMNDDVNTTNNIILPSTISSTFNMNLYSSLSDNDQNSDGMDVLPSAAALLHCGGEAWIETIVPFDEEDAQKNIERRRTKCRSSFSIMKLPTPETSQLHYSVPIPRR